MDPIKYPFGVRGLAESDELVKANGFQAQHVSVHNLCGEKSQDADMLCVALVLVGTLSVGGSHRNRAWSSLNHGILPEEIAHCSVTDEVNHRRSGTGNSSCKRQ